MQVSEQQALEQAQSGNFDNFKVLIDLYEVKITRYVKRLLNNSDDYEDIVQEVFIKAYINIRSFEARGSLSAWLYRIAHNQAISHIRKEKNTTQLHLDIEDILPFAIAKEDAHTSSERDLIKQLLDHLLSEIDIKHKEILVLYFYEELSYKEIARVLSIPIARVGVRLSRAKEKMLHCAKSRGIEYN
jgi:RNA polymerase sigma-70 factor, ECF subfamily